MTRVIAILTVDPDKKQDLIAAARPAIEATRQEEGCISYDLYESVSEPTKLAFVEEWDNADRLPGHSKTDHMRSFGRVAMQCFTAPPEINII